MKKRIIQSLPIDEAGVHIKIGIPMHNGLVLIGQKRCRRLVADAAYGNMTLIDMVSAAYVQGMTDAGMAIQEGRE